MNNSCHTGNSNWYITELPDKLLFYIVLWMYRARECCLTRSEEVTNLLSQELEKKLQVPFIIPHR